MYISALYVNITIFMTCLIKRTQVKIILLCPRAPDCQIKDTFLKFR